MKTTQEAADMAASFQRVAARHLTARVQRAIRFCQLQSAVSNCGTLQHLVVCGGVAANQYIRRAVSCAAEELSESSIVLQVKF